MIVRKQTIRFSPDRTPMPRKAKIGYESDNMVERLVFVLPDIAESQTATMMMDGEYANMVTLERSDEDDRYFADMTAERVGAAGEIECYIVIDGENGEVWNSGTFSLATGEVPAVNEELAERYPDAIEQMRTEMATHRVEMAEQVRRAEDAADRADGAADGKEGGYYMPAVDGDMLKWTPSKENMPEVPAANVRGPQGSDGAPGRDGKPGADGVSPRVSVEDIDGGHRVTFVDAEGMKTIDVLDGEKGAGGAQGPAGNPGVHVGGDDPEDPDVRLWIDPEGEDYPAVSYQPQTLTEEQKTVARSNIGAASVETVNQLSEDKADKKDIPAPYTLPAATAETLGGVKIGAGLRMDGDVLGVVPESELELIEKIIIGYELLTAQPEDWGTNWTAYYRNTGTERNPKYALISDASAPVWEDNVYFAYTGAAVEYVARTKEPDGIALKLQGLYIRYTFPIHEQETKYGPFSCTIRAEEINAYIPYATNIEISNAAKQKFLITILARIENGLSVGLFNALTDQSYNPTMGGMITPFANHVGGRRYNWIYTALGKGFPAGTEIEIWGIRA